MQLPQRASWWIERTRGLYRRDCCYLCLCDSWGIFLWRCERTKGPRVKLIPRCTSRQWVMRHCSWLGLRSLVISWISSSGTPSSKSSCRWTERSRPTRIRRLSLNSGVSLLKARCLSDALSRALTVIADGDVLIYTFCTDILSFKLFTARIFLSANALSFPRRQSIIIRSASAKTTLSFLNTAIHLVKRSTESFSPSSFIELGLIFRAGVHVIRILTSGWKRRW